MQASCRNRALAKAVPRDSELQNQRDIHRVELLPSLGFGVKGYSMLNRNNRPCLRDTLEYPSPLAAVPST